VHVILKETENFLAPTKREITSPPDLVRRRKYGLELGEFAQLFAKQKGLCAICNKPYPLCVDHNHKTGKVRGLLCHACNVGLGKFFDDPALLIVAAKYLAV